MSENSNPVREEVRARYASAALSVTNERRRSLLADAPAATTCCSTATATEAPAATCCSAEDTTSDTEATDASTNCCAPATIDESLVFGSALYDDRSRTCRPAKPCSTSAREEASTCFSPPAGSAPPGSPTAST